MLTFEQETAIYCLHSNLESFKDIDYEAIWETVGKDPELFREIVLEIHDNYDREAQRLRRKVRELKPFEAVHVFKEELYPICMMKIRNGEDTAHFSELLEKTQRAQGFDLEKAKASPVKSVIEILGYKVNRQDFMRCPFHEEKTASLKVYPRTNTFYCFGCLKRGDVIQFVREAKQMTFREAVAFLNDFG